MVDVDRIFAELDVLSDAITQRQAQYLERIRDIPPPWTSMEKVNFKTRIKRLQSDLVRWNEHIETLRSKAIRIKDAGDKAALYFRIDTCSRTHEALIDDVITIVDDGNGYLELDPDTINATVTQQQGILPVAKIPALNIQKFNGDYLKWKTFWQRFDINVHSHPFSKVEKLDALVGLLEGIALEEVAGFEIAEENYDTVVKTLQERFGNSKLILKELYSNLRSIPAATPYAKSIRSTVNIISNMCRQLQNYGVDIDNDALQAEIIEKMPPKQQKDLTWFQLKNENVTTEMILDQMKESALKAEIEMQLFSKKQIFIEESSNDFRPSNWKPDLICVPTDTGGKLKCSLCDEHHTVPVCPNYVSPKEKIFVSPERSNISQSHIVKQDRKMLQPTDTVGKNKCSLCDGDHWAMKCQKFDSPDKKIQQLRARNYCIKCSSKYHDTQSCNSKVECDICKGNHYSYLCTTRNIRSTAFVTVGKKQGMLLTKEVLICNPVTNETAETVVIFDTGSQQSYISDNLIRQLKLEALQEEQLNVTGFGAMTSDYISSLVKLQIKTTDGHMDIYANSAKKIATTVPVVRSELFELNDIKTVYKSADILIGMDYFFKFVTSFENYDDNLHIVHSKVGEMICKNVPQNYKTTVSSMVIKSSQPIHKAEHDVQQNHESSMKKVEEQKALNVNEKQKTDKVLCPKFVSNIQRTLKVKTDADFTSTVQQSQIKNVNGDIQMLAENDISNRGSAVQKVLQRQNKYVRPPSCLTTATAVNDTYIQQREKPLPQKFQYLSPQQQSDYLALCGKNTTVRGGEGLAEHPKRLFTKAMNDKNLVLSETEEPQKEYKTKSRKNENNNGLDKDVRGEKDSDDPASHTYLVSFDY